MNPLDQALADFSAAEQFLSAADGAKSSNDAKLAAAKTAADTTNQADVDAVKAFNESADKAIAAITASKR